MLTIADQNLKHNTILFKVQSNGEELYFVYHRDQILDVPPMTREIGFQLFNQIINHHLKQEAKR